VEHEARRQLQSSRGGAARAPRQQVQLRTKSLVGLVQAALVWLRRWGKSVAVKNSSRKTFYGGRDPKRFLVSNTVYAAPFTWQFQSELGRLGLG
jgi:hypothetical protein